MTKRSVHPIRRRAPRPRLDDLARLGSARRDARAEPEAPGARTGVSVQVRAAAIPPAVARDRTSVDIAHQQGRLEQACPDCGTWEAAGRVCSKCLRPMGPDDWYPNGDLTRRAVARQIAPQKPQTRVKRGPGRPRAVLGGSQVPTSSEVPGGDALLPGTSQDAGPSELSPGPPGPDVLRLGL